MREISGGRWLVYVAASLLSGLAWASLVMVLLDVDAFIQRMPSLLLAGAGSGLLVGVAMNWFYRSPSWIPTLLSAPLANYLGAFLFMTMDAVGRGHTEPGIVIVTAVYSLAVFGPPLILLLPLAWWNGLLLRRILLGGPRTTT